MFQALRNDRQPENSRVWIAVVSMLLLPCALAIPGCASSMLGNCALTDDDRSKADESTIRSQSSADSDTRLTAGESVQADYHPAKSEAQANGLATTLDENTAATLPNYASGHSFVQRRARLGKPRMLPDADSLATTNANPASFSVNSGIPSDSLEPAATNSEPPGSGRSGGENAPATTRRGLNLSDAGWQPIPLDSKVGNPSVGSSGQPVDTAISSDGRTNAAETHRPPSDNGGLHQPTDLSDESSGDQPEMDSSRLDSRDLSDEQSSGDDSAMGINEVSPREPGVLERLRGLYVPRRDEPVVDRSKKPTRRWTDPFGLLRERDPETADAAVGATTQLPGSIDMAGSPIETSQPPVAATTSDDLLKPLIDLLEQELEGWPMLPNGTPRHESDWRRRQTDLRMMYLIAGRTAESIRVIEALPEPEQEFWQSLMLAVDAYRRTDDSAERAEHLTETLNYVRAASRQLQPLSKLRIRRLNFCNRIDGFGMIDEFPVFEFNAGQPLLLYAEIENYMSELTANGQYRSEFAARIEFVRDGETEPIVSRTIQLPGIEDFCATERTDYFQSYELTVPSLSPGRYRLRLRIRDQLSLQTTATEIPFEIRPLGNQRIE